MTIRDVLASAFGFLFDLEAQMNEMYEKMAEASEEEMERYMAVSYTHLDVYKRQYGG